MTKRKIPARWQNYKPLGRTIDGTRLLPFKVPLSKELSQYMPLSHRFTPEDLLRMVKQSGLGLGLIIDLTNTSRYYNQQTFVQAGIEYHKLAIIGHVIPEQANVQRFITIVEEFIYRHPNDDLVIGVHCTHGINRTGYLLCRYMIECLGWTARSALVAFGGARGHNMERSNYIADLHSLSEARLSKTPSGHVHVMQVEDFSTQSATAGDSGSSVLDTTQMGHSSRTVQGSTFDSKRSKDQYHYQPYNRSGAKTRQCHQGCTRDFKRSQDCDGGKSSNAYQKQWPCHKAPRSRNNGPCDQQPPARQFNNHPAPWQSNWAWANFHGYQSHRQYDHNTHTTSYVSREKQDRTNGKM